MRLQLWLLSHCWAAQMRCAAHRCRRTPGRVGAWTHCAPALRPSVALRASNDDGDRKLDIPEQPEYDVEGVDLKGVLKGDPVTLTLIGFGLIAFNFFVLAGFGSGGL